MQNSVYPLRMIASSYVILAILVVLPFGGEKLHYLLEIKLQVITDGEVSEDKWIVADYQAMTVEQRGKVG